MGAPAQAEHACCGTCIFFDPPVTPESVSVYATRTEEARPEAPAIGVCRRFPPVPSAQIMTRHHDLTEIIGRWSLVDSRMWCGEWKEEIA